MWAQRPEDETSRRLPSAKFWWLIICEAPEINQVLAPQWDSAVLQPGPLSSFNSSSSASSVGEYSGRADRAIKIKKNHTMKHQYRQTLCTSIINRRLSLNRGPLCVVVPRWRCDWPHIPVPETRGVPASNGHHLKPGGCCEIWMADFGTEYSLTDGYALGFAVL